jgi:hypothetical protein
MITYTLIAGMWVAKGRTSVTPTGSVSGGFGTSPFSTTGFGA